MKTGKIYIEEQNGNVLFMILIAVVLLGALTYTMTGSKGDEAATSVSAGRISEDLKNQAQMIRSALLECTLVHNYGYPAIASADVKDLQCRISNSAEQPIFTGNASRILPVPPVPFGDWKYTNDGAVGNIVISIATPPAKAGGGGVKSALGRMAESFAVGEADIVNDGTTASFTLHITRP